MTPAEAYKHGYQAAVLVLKQLSPIQVHEYDVAKTFICLDCGACTFDPKFGCDHQRNARKPAGVPLPGDDTTEKR